MFSASRNNETISFSQTVLGVIVAFAYSKTESERIFIHQHVSHVEVIKVLENFMISCARKNTTSSLIVECDILNTWYRAARA